MNGAPPSQTELCGLDPTRAATVAALVASIAAEFDVAMGSMDRVLEKCESIKKVSGPRLFHNSTAPIWRRFFRFSPSAPDVLQDLSSICSSSCPTSRMNHGPILEGMLTARDEEIVRRALHQAMKLAQCGRLAVDLSTAHFFAERIETEGSPLCLTEHLSILVDLFGYYSAAVPSENALRSMFLNETDGRLRRFAAKLLNLGGQPVPGEVSRLILEEHAYEVIAPYLDFTRATYLDLLYLAPVPGELPPWLAGIQKAEALCGQSTPEGR